MAKADVPYNQGIPDVTPSTDGSGAGPMGVHADPNAFGAQVGGAVEKLGNTATSAVDQRQGMLNETMATNAETGAATELGDVTAKYKSLEGLAAVAARPQYDADVAAIKQKYAATLATPESQFSFNKLWSRHEIYALQDGASYAASQIKKADVQSAQGSMSLAISRSADLSVASNDARFEDNIHDLNFGKSRILQTQGYDAGTGMKMDPKTGEISFDTSTPAGKNAQYYSDSMNEETVGKAWKNRIEALAGQDVNTAYQKFSENRDRIPGETATYLAHWLEPKIRNAQSEVSAQNSLQNEKNTYLKSLGVTPPGETSDTGSGSIIKDVVLKHEGGFVKSDGATNAPAIYGINQKWHPDEYAEAKRISDTQGDGAGQQYAQDFYKKNYWDAKGIGNLPQATQAVVMDGVVNHSTAFGDKLIQAAKDGSSPQQLIDMRRTEYQRLANADPTYAKSLPAWNARLDDLQKNSNSAPATYGPQLTQPTAGMPSFADHLRENYTQYLDNAETHARQQHGDDPVYIENARNRADQMGRKVIAQQEIAYKADADLVDKAAFGGFAKDGSKPSSVPELTAADPSVAAAWGRLQTQQPKVADDIEKKILTKNSDPAQIAAKGQNRYGAGFYDLLQNVYSPNGINDKRDLYQYAGEHGVITNDGVAALAKELDLKNTPEGQAVAQGKSRLFAAGAQAIYGPAQSYGLSDPKGEQLHHQWLALAMSDYDKGVSAGKTPTQLLTPESPDYVGKSLSAFKRTEEERQKDNLEEPPLTLDSYAAAIQFGRLSKPQAAADVQPILAKMWTEGKITKPELQSQLIRFGLIRGNPAPTATVPRLEE